jgi:hypothetical protein
MKKIAEGLEQNGILTGAGKTKWYDSTINKILRNEKLNNAVTETFTNRNTPIAMDTPAFSNEFLSDSMHKTRERSTDPVSLLLHFYWLGVYYTDRNSYYFVPLESQYFQRSLEVFFFHKNVICVIC